MPGTDQQDNPMAAANSSAPMAASTVQLNHPSTSTAPSEERIPVSLPLGDDDALKPDGKH